MGAQKKCQLIVNTVILLIFDLIFFSILIENIYQSYKIKSKSINEAWITLIICLILLFIPLLIVYKAFKYDIKFIMVYKKKNSEIKKIEIETNNINNINNEGEYFVKRTEYKFKNTKIRKRNSNKSELYKKIVSCISILSDGKIIFGFTEGTILVCTINELKCELIQNFSFNKFKLKKILSICESQVNDGEIMVSVKDDILPIKIIKLNLEYKYSLIKELARDKPYIVFQEIAIKNLNNNNINNNLNENNLDENYIFKILSFNHGKYLLCNKKGLLIKEKVYDLNCEDYISTKEYICNNETHEIIHDIIKINNDSFATLENKEDSTNIYFYKINNLTKENKFIENVISSPKKANRLCLINESLLSVIDENCVIFINIISKEKTKIIEIENILDVGVDFFYDGGVIFLRKNFLDGLNVPYIVKIKKNQGSFQEYNSFSLTNTIQDYKDINTKIKYCESEIKTIKCLRNTGIVLLTNDQGKLFIWEEIDKNKSNNNSINTINI